MPTDWQRSGRRHSFRRALLRFVLPTVGVALVVAFVVGAVIDIGPASTSYRRTVDRGFAALAASVAAEANATGSALTSVLSTAPSLDRTAFFGDLDRLAADAARQQQQLDGAVPPAPAGGSGAGCLSAVSARASAVDGIRQALEGLLGGTTGESPLPPAQATTELDQSSATLAGADASWAACRRALRVQPGHARLAVSRWITDAHPWSQFSLSLLADAVVASPTLAAKPSLAISALVTDPAFLPGPSSPVVTPTHELGVHVVVSDTGNVDEPDGEVTATLVGSPTPESLSRTVAVDADDSVTVVLGSLAVAPGGSYTLELTAAPPSGVGGASSSVPVQVVSVPPTTTTSTTSTTTTSTVPKHRPKS